MQDELDNLERRVFTLEKVVESLEKIEEKRGKQFDHLMDSISTLTNEVRHLVRSMDKIETRVDKMRQDVGNAKLITDASKWLAATVVGGAVLTIIAFLFGGPNG